MTEVLAPGERIARLPTGSELLDAWERGNDRSPPHRALLLAALAEPERTIDSLSRMPLGERDARLLRLRQGLFGDRLDARGECPDCGAPLALEVEIGEVLRSTPVSPATGTEDVELCGYRVRFRSPSTDDVLAAVEGGARGDAYTVLLERCVEAWTPVTPANPETPLEHAASAVPKHLAGAISEAMSQADPLAEILFQVSCPSCGSDSSLSLDITSYLWIELDAWARRTLREVHVLASCYGWTEAEVLSLPASRRRIYLELAESWAI